MKVMARRILAATGVACLPLCADAMDWSSVKLSDLRILLGGNQCSIYLNVIRDNVSPQWKMTYEEDFSSFSNSYLHKLASERSISGADEKNISKFLMLSISQQNFILGKLCAANPDMKFWQVLEMMYDKYL